jgi:hypothetical protein
MGEFLTRNWKRKIMATRGRKPGGPKTGGRQKGSPNKTTSTLRDMARQYTAVSLKALSDIVINGESEAARVSAANALLDRGYGKPTTVIGGDEDGGPARFIHHIELIDGEFSNHDQGSDPAEA